MKKEELAEKYILQRGFRKAEGFAIKTKEMNYCLKESYIYYSI